MAQVRMRKGEVNEKERDNEYAESTSFEPISRVLIEDLTFSHSYSMIMSVPPSKKSPSPKGTKKSKASTPAPISSPDVTSAPVSTLGPKGLKKKNIDTLSRRPGMKLFKVD